MNGQRFWAAIFSHGNLCYPNFSKIFYCKIIVIHTKVECPRKKESSRHFLYTTYIYIYIYMELIMHFCKNCGMVNSDPNENPPGIILHDMLFLPKYNTIGNLIYRYNKFIYVTMCFHVPKILYWCHFLIKFTIYVLNLCFVPRFHKFCGGYFLGLIKYKVGMLLQYVVFQAKLE